MANTKNQSRQKKKSIQYRITYMTWTLLATVVISYVIVNYYYQRNTILDRMKNEALNIAASIDQVTASSVYNEDYSTVVDHCMPLVQKGGSIDYIYVVKYDGFSLLFMEDNWTMETIEEERYVKPSFAENYEFLYEKRLQKTVFHYAYPFNYSGINWGWIHVGLSLDKYNQDIKDSILRAFILAVIALGLGLIVSSVFARKIIQPILELDTISKQIADGDLSVRAEIETRDELESLADSFNTMTDQLQKSRDELEQRVEMRTLELAEANKKLVEEISARKKSESEIATSLKEKEVLLKEIHHRVKNNLQIISSLLYLQSRNIDDETTAAMFTDSRNRIISMALIHENLYRSDDLAFINIEEYLENLVFELSSSYKSEEKHVLLDLKIEPIPLNIDKAIPCGLIINELISNAYKYAFDNDAEEENHKIQLDLKMADTNRVHLQISDNGKGLPEGMDFRESPSLGLQLVNSLVSQLDGEIEYIGENGSMFKIDFAVADN